MDDLVIEPERGTISREYLEAFRQEFAAGGITSGRFAMGDVTAEPLMVYLLWHEAGELPVSMLTEIENFTSEAGTRAAARAFLAKWKRLRSAR